MNVLDIIQKHKIVAIVRLDDLSTAQHITEALVEGGIRAIEFTLTNPDAVKTIAAMRKTVDEAVAIGAGSVITVEQVRAVADAGAQFVVSPVSKQDVIAACLKRDLPAMPGAFTPTEIQQAWEWGASVVKVFPANHLRQALHQGCQGAAAPPAPDADRRHQCRQSMRIPRSRRFCSGCRLVLNQQRRCRRPRLESSAQECRTLRAATRLRLVLI